MISFSSFQEGVRHSVWKESFEKFLPLVINRSHAKRMKPELEKAIERIFKENSQNAFEVNLLTVISKLMNWMVVSLMTENGEISRHLSEKALLGSFQGYFNVIKKGIAGYIICCFGVQKCIQKYENMQTKLFPILKKMKNFAQKAKFQI